MDQLAQVSLRHQHGRTNERSREASARHAEGVLARYSRLWQRRLSSGGNRLLWRSGEMHKSARSSRARHGFGQPNHRGAQKAVPLRYPFLPGLPSKYHQGGAAHPPQNAAETEASSPLPYKTLAANP